MILELIANGTCLILVLSGIAILGYGQWDKHGLKFAAVGLSTAAAIWVLAASQVFDPPGSFGGEDVSMWQFYHIVRNIALILFHISVGRDAIRYKNRERRSRA